MDVPGTAVDSSFLITKPFSPNPFPRDQVNPNLNFSFSQQSKRIDQGTSQISHFVASDDVLIGKSNITSKPSTPGITQARSPNIEDLLKQKATNARVESDVSTIKINTTPEVS